MALSARSGTLVDGSMYSLLWLNSYSSVSRSKSTPDLAVCSLARGVVICLGVVALLLVLLMCKGAFAYSVLTHEEIVDLLWTE